tara:strand:+ start:375 stop:2408 length:2034 start_codon:yes stop_codon:yes gene_type:complete
MATLTAGNFYWTGYKAAGQDPDFRYVRGTKAYGTALSFDGGVGGCTGYDWNETGNWVIETAGFTNDPDNPGGFLDGVFFEGAPRTPRAGDNVFFKALTPDDPGIIGYYPASECLFGGILGGTYTDGGTWNSGTGFGANDLNGNLNKLFVENSYSNFRGASFELGNVFGSTFGQSFLGASADIDIRGLTGLFGMTARMGFQITNFDGTTANFFGNTFYGFTSGGTGNSAAGFSSARPMQGVIAGGFLQNGDYFVGTNAGRTSYGMTHATESLYRSIVTGISNGDVKMQISPFVNGMTSFGLTMNEPGPRGNKNFGDFAQLFPHGMESRSFILNGGLSAGRDGVTAFSGGTDNKVEQPILAIKSKAVTIRGDSSVNLNHSRITQQAFILSKCQFNYNGGIINQAIFDREDIDYLGTPKTAASLLDTEVTNSLVISGGGLQSKTTFDGSADNTDDEGNTSAGAFVTDRDVSGTRPVTYVRPTNTIPTVEIDAFRHGNVILEGAATTLNMKPEFPHRNGENSQGKVFINKPLNDPGRITYSAINLKSFNDAENIAGNETNNLLFLNAGLTIDDLDIGAGTVAVGPGVGDRKITVVKGEMSELAVLKARSQTNPSYQGFQIGDDFTGLTSNAEGILISHPAANIEFSTGHYVLASFADGNTGADTGFRRPGSAVPMPPSGKG